MKKYLIRLQKVLRRERLIHSKTYSILRYILKELNKSKDNNWNIREFSFSDYNVDNKTTFELVYTDVIYRFLRRYTNLNISINMGKHYNKITVRFNGVK